MSFWSGFRLSVESKCMRFWLVRGVPWKSPRRWREDLFDANTPAPLARFLRGHEVVRADELGWQGLENGALLDAAEHAGFDESMADAAANCRTNRHSRRFRANRADGQSRCRDAVGCLPLVSHCETQESVGDKSGRWRAGIELNQSRMFCHTGAVVQKIAVTLDQRTVADLDRWVREGRYPNRSRALQSAVNLLSEREKRTRLARELTKLDPQEEKQLAEQGLGDRAWPEY